MKIGGRILFWLTWPLVWLYAPMVLRARVLVCYKNEYLLVRPYFGSGAWQLPGGGKKYRELAVQTALRELKEEVDISVATKQMRLLSPMHTFIESGMLLRYIIFGVTLKERPTITLQKHEIAEYIWVKKDTKLKLAEHIKYAFSIVSHLAQK